MKVLTTLLALSLLALWLFASSPTLSAKPIAAQSADDFVNSIGVNTHFGYSDRPYGTHYEAVAAKLDELGIRHIRDSVVPIPAVAQRIRNLHDKFGIGAVQFVGPRVDSPHGWQGKLDPSKIDGVLETIKTLYGDANEAIEGPNEYDITHKNDKPEADDGDWTGTIQSYTQRLYEKVKADPVLKDRPVIGPSMAHASNATMVPDLSAYMTFGNMHPYPGGWNPIRQLDDYNLPKTQHITGKRPLWATESGYHNAMANAPGGHNPAPESAAGKYGPRLVAEYFRHGIARTYFYELLDEGVDPADAEANFGLLHNDLSEKPIFTALKSTIALLKDPGPAFTPGKLDYTITPDVADIHQLLLEKRDGRFYLLLWQEVPFYDAGKRKDVAVKPREITMKLDGSIRTIRTWLPSSRGTDEVEKFDQRKTVTLLVPDELLIVEITPANAR